MAIYFSAVILPLISGCASAKPEPEKPTEIQELRSQVGSLQGKLNESESKINSLEERLTVLKAQSGLSTTNVSPGVSQYSGKTPSAALDGKDPEAGMIQDEAVLSFRKAMVLYQNAQFPEAILAFSSFLDRFADHTLAGSAQFYIGECYYKENEFKLALQEYQRVITSYDRSHRISDSLRRIVDTETALNNAESATRYKQSLLSLFPQSPAASGISLAETRTAEKPSQVEHPAAAPAKLDVPPESESYPSVEKQ